MHSKIFQIEVDPVYELDYIDESSIPEWFELSIADYVEANNDLDERVKAIGRLMSTLGSVADIRGDALTFNPNVTDYFDSKFECFRKEIAKLPDIDFNDFATNEGIRNILNRVNDAYNDRYGFYVYDGFEDSLITLDSFMRHVRPGETYYIGGVVDYHF